MFYFLFSILVYLYQPNRELQKFLLLFQQSPLAKLHPLYILRMTGGLMYLSGALVMTFNVWMTLAGKLRDEAPMTSAAYDPDKDKPIVGARPDAVSAE